ncbi:hypothetical protein DE146DRAFT_748774 [Phaeosphaeria sp. MPI-PUGE-AT-0046c]|nr:hypothetical protein DE146DRAFT_748774 [Phaeosphaeria sp. MPI-PUGE-AT-0046c]
MSNISLSSLSYISRENLAHAIRASHQDQAQTQAQDTSSDAPKPAEPAGLPPHIAVIDVRDSDHIGGHIRGSTWVPSNELDYKLPEVLRTMRDKEVVVFHCALSQQRGPSAALRYLREKERLEGLGGEGESGEKDGGVEDGNGEGDRKTKQKVLVLGGGFTEWQEKYGRDERLTEGWRKDVWEGGY